MHPSKGEAVIISRTARESLNPGMKVVIDTLIEKGMRDDYVVLVGGAPLNEAFANSIGADSYCRDAAVAVETAKQYMAKRQGSALAARA